jgi:hypothetical protein
VRVGSTTVVEVGSGAGGKVASGAGLQPAEKETTRMNERAMMAVRKALVYIGYLLIQLSQHQSALRMAVAPRISSPD